MTAAELYAIKTREVLEEAKRSGIKVEASVFCDEYNHEVSIRFFDGTHVEEVEIND